MRQQVNRRAFLASAAGTAFGSGDDTARSIGRAHEEIWKRFVDPKYAYLYDYAGCWCTPILNGAFFNGHYLDALCNRWRLDPSKDNAETARRIAAGQVRQATAGTTPGFVARGISAGGCHYFMGSDDQTFTWVYGMWRYVNTALPSRDERRRIVDLIARVVGAVEKLGWRIPCDPAKFGTLHSRGKYLMTHTDGENRSLLKLYLEAGFDVADSVCPCPMTRCHLDEIRDALKDRIAIWGGIASVALCVGSCDWYDFKRSIDDLLSRYGRESRFVLGVSNMVTADAEWDRLQYITDSVRKLA
jgi:hypothetical protein